MLRSQRGGVDKGSSPLKPKISAVPSLRNRNSVMDANREKELAELKDSIKKAEARRDTLFSDKDRAWEKVQDEIIILQRRLEEKEKLGESQPPAHAANFCCHAW